MSKFLNDKDYFMCTGGIMPAQILSHQVVAGKKDGTKYLTSKDVLTKTTGDFICKKLMLLMAIVAALVALTAGAGLAVIIAAAAAAGAAGAGLGALICGHMAAAARIWMLDKPDVKIGPLQIPAVTDKSFMLCSALGTEKITYAPFIKNWWQALMVGVNNFAVEMFKCVMAGAAVAGGAVLLTEGVGAFFANAASNYLMTWTTGWGLGLRGFMGASDYINQKYVGGASDQEAMDSALGNAAFGMEKGTANSAYNVATGQGKLEDYAGLLAWGAPVGKSKNEEGFNPDAVDNMDGNPWQGKPQRGKTGFLESSRMKRSEMQAYKESLKQQGIDVVTDKNGALGDQQRAGFDYNTGKVYLRKGATKYEAFHEAQHAKQWKELGVDAYKQQSRVQREQYVYDQIMKNKDQFSPAELDHAKRYIDRLRNENGLGPVDAMEAGEGKKGGDGDLFEDPAVANPGSNSVAYDGYGGDVNCPKDKTTTVIGKFEDTVNGHGTKEILKMPDGSFTRGGENKGGVNILDLPSDKYQDLLDTYGETAGKEKFWQEYNQPFLEDSFKRGDDVRVLSDPNAPANRTGFYERELREIEGYTDASGNKVPGLKDKYGYDYDPKTHTYKKR
jgi:hypothetical protein